MSTLIQIVVTNNSDHLTNFYFFQEPAVYEGGPETYSNSLLGTPILPHSISGSNYTFLLELQYYAGVQQRVNPPEVGQPSGYASAIQQVGLTPAPGGTATNNKTIMSVSPLGLAPPINDKAVQPGAFRITSPVYNPKLEQYNGGTAVQLGTGAIVLSNYVTVNPSTNLDCQPILKFYVATGAYTAGTVINFSSSSVHAALCDATSGFTTFNVSYNADGTWTTTPSTKSLAITSEAKLISIDSNAQIKNEAGTAVISTGVAANFNDPVTITNLSNPNAIILHHEYQVGATGGPFVGRMCTAKSGNSATFS
ncbi:hypothetical protein ACM9HF_04095 [Colwellia sp. RE-S-Sl-9]